MTAGALACLAAVLAGPGLVSLALPARADRLARVVLGLALGAGVVSASWAAVLFAVGPRESALVAKDAALAAAGAWLLWRARRREDPPAPDAAPALVPGSLRALFAGGVLLDLALFLEHTLRVPDGGWDAWMIWNLRARALFRAGAGFASAFSPELVYTAHTDYPLLVPGLVVQGDRLAGESPAVAPLVALLCGALAVAALVAALARLRGAPWGLAAGLLVLATPCFLSFTANQCADVPLSAFVTAAFACAALALERERGADLLVLAGAFAGLGAWTKNEGALYLGCLLAALVLAPRPLARAGRLREAAFVLAGALPSLALLAWFKRAYAFRNDLLHHATPAEALARATDLGRWGALAGALARRVVYFQNWGLLLAAALVCAAVLAVRRAGPPSARVLGLALALALLSLQPIFVLNPHPLLWFFRAAIDRLLTQLWPSTLLAIFLALAPLAEDPRPFGARGGGG